jgi:hypothetical protein
MSSLAHSWEEKLVPGPYSTGRRCFARSPSPHPVVTIKGKTLCAGPHRCLPSALAAAPVLPPRSAQRRPPPPKLTPGALLGAAAPSGGKRVGREFETLPLRNNTPTIKCRNTDCPKFSLLPPKVKYKTVSTEVVCPLFSRNYKVSATVGVNTVIMAPVRAILDTGWGPNLIRAEILPEDWELSRL